MDVDQIVCGRPNFIGPRLSGGDVTVIMPVFVPGMGFYEDGCILEQKAPQDLCGRWTKGLEHTVHPKYVSYSFGYVGSVK